MPRCRVFSLGYDVGTAREMCHCRGDVGMALWWAGMPMNAAMAPNHKWFGAIGRARRLACR